MEPASCRPQTPPREQPQLMREPSSIRSRLFLDEHSKSPPTNSEMQTDYSDDDDVSTISDDDLVFPLEDINVSSPPLPEDDDTLGSLPSDIIFINVPDNLEFGSMPPWYPLFPRSMFGSDAAHSKSSQLPSPPTLEPAVSPCQIHDNISLEHSIIGSNSGDRNGSIDAAPSSNIPREQCIARTVLSDRNDNASSRKRKRQIVIELDGETIVCDERGQGEWCTSVARKKV